MAEKKDRFWWGPVTTGRTARQIINVTSWIFIGIGGLAAISSVITPSPPGGAPPIAGALMVVLLLVVPAAFLISRKNRVPAAILMVVTGLVALLAVIATFSLSSIQGGAAVLMWLIPAFWLILFVLSWRSFRAASALRRLKTEGTTSEATGMVFD